MDWQVTPVAAIYAAAGLTGLVTASIAWRFHPARGARLLALTGYSAAIWALAYMLGFFNTDLVWKRNMIRIEYIGIIGAAYFYPLFALAYTSFSRWLNRTTMILLGIIPAITVLLALTNDLHPFLYQSFGLTAVDGLIVTTKTYGIGFWMFVAYSYLAVAGGSLLLIIDVLRHPQMFKGQAVLLGIASIIPLIPNVLYIIGANPVRPYDPSPVAFVISEALVLIGMSRFRFLDLTPIAHDIVFKNVTSGVVIVNAEGRILEMNPAAERILGREQDQVAGKFALSVFPEHKELIKQFVNVTDAHTRIGIRGRMYNMQIAPLFPRSRTDEVIGRVILLTDVTEQEQLIAELNAYAHTVAHDLKTPLGTIMGFTELLRIELGSPISEKADYIMNSITRSSLKMGSIVNSLLMLAEVRNLEDLTLTTVNMGKVVADALSRYELALKESSAEVIVPETWPTGITSFAPWIEEVWANYINNALKYGGAPPRIEIGWAHAGDQRVRFYVRDNGQGLTEEDRSKLFTEFSRLDQHVGITGHGLGLSIVKRIADRLGGEVGVESKVGEGSTFYFVLPVEKIEKQVLEVTVKVE